MRKIIYNLALILFFALMIFSGYKLYRHYIVDKAQSQIFDELELLIEDEEETQAKTPLAKYKELFDKNPDMKGWLKIEDTAISFPVMQTADRPNFYLRRNFNKEYSPQGVPYIAEATDLAGDDNIIIYGHNMRNGKIFGELEKYLKEDFFLSHPVISFDSYLYFEKYEIFAVFKTTSDAFRYHEFINAESEAEYKEFIKRCKALALYDTGINPVYKDKLLLLSTCEYSNEDGRLVVAAKKIR